MVDLSVAGTPLIVITTASNSRYPRDDFPDETELYKAITVRFSPKIRWQV